MRVFKWRKYRETLYIFKREFFEFRNKNSRMLDRSMKAKKAKRTVEVKGKPGNMCKLMKKKLELF